MNVVLAKLEECLDSLLKISIRFLGALPEQRKEIMLSATSSSCIHLVNALDARSIGTNSGDGDHTGEDDKDDVSWDDFPDVLLEEEEGVPMNIPVPALANQRQSRNTKDSVMDAKSNGLPEARKNGTLPTRRWHVADPPNLFSMRPPEESDSESENSLSSSSSSEESTAPAGVCAGEGRDPTSCTGEPQPRADHQGVGSVNSGNADGSSAGASGRLSEERSLEELSQCDLPELQRIAKGEAKRPLPVLPTSERSVDQPSQPTAEAIDLRRPEELSDADRAAIEARRQRREQMRRCTEEEKKKRFVSQEKAEERDTLLASAEKLSDNVTAATVMPSDVLSPDAFARSAPGNSCARCCGEAKAKRSSGDSGREPITVGSIGGTEDHKWIEADEERREEFQAALASVLSQYQ